MVLKMICQSGRCVLGGSEGGERLDPLEWDDGEPWRFHLVVAPEETGDAFGLQGILKRGEEKLEISAPRLIVPGWSRGCWQ